MEQLIRKEAQKLINAQMREARIQRQIQVRQQAVAWNEARRKKFEEEKEKGIKLLSDRVTEQVRLAAIENIKLLTKQNDLAMAEIGMAHRSAAGMQQVERLKALKRLKNTEVAQNRGAAAMSKQLRVKQSESARNLAILKRKEDVRKAEDAKSKDLISRRPLSVTNIIRRSEETISHPKNYQQSFAKILRTSTSNTGMKSQKSKISQASSKKSTVSKPLLPTSMSSSLEFLEKNKALKTPSEFFKMARIKVTGPRKDPAKEDVWNNKQLLAALPVRNNYMKTTIAKESESSTSQYVRYFDAALPRGETKFIAPEGLAVKETGTSPDAWEKGRQTARKSQEDQDRKTKRQEEMKIKAEERGKIALNKARLQKNLLEVRTELLRQISDTDIDILANKSQQAFLGLAESDDFQVTQDNTNKDNYISSNEFSVVGTDEEFDFPQSPKPPKTIKEYIVTDVDILANKPRQAFLRPVKSDAVQITQKKSAQKDDYSSSDEFSVVGTDEEYYFSQSPKPPKTIKEYIVTDVDILANKPRQAFLRPVKSDAVQITQKKSAQKDDYSSSNEYSSYDKRVSSGSTVAEVRIRTTSNESLHQQSNGIPALDDLVKLPTQKTNTLSYTSGTDRSISSSSSSARTDSKKPTYKQYSTRKIDHRSLTPLDYNRTPPTKVTEDGNTESLTNSSKSGSKSSGDTDIFVTLKVKKTKGNSTVPSDSANSSKSTDYYNPPEGPFTSTPDGKLKPKHKRESKKDPDDKMKKLVLNHLVKKVLTRPREEMDLMQTSSSSSSVVRVDAELVSYDSMPFDDSNTTDNQSHNSTSKTSSSHSTRSTDSFIQTYKNPKGLPTLSEENSELGSQTSFH